LPEPFANQKVGQGDAPSASGLEPIAKKIVWAVPQLNALCRARLKCGLLAAPIKRRIAH